MGRKAKTSSLPTPPTSAFLWQVSTKKLCELQEQLIEAIALVSITSSGDFMLPGYKMVLKERTKREGEAALIYVSTDSLYGQIMN